MYNYIETIIIFNILLYNYYISEKTIQLKQWRKTLGKVL